MGSLRSSEKSFIEEDEGMCSSSASGHSFDGGFCEDLARKLTESPVSRGKKDSNRKVSVPNRAKKSELWN